MPNKTTTDNIKQTNDLIKALRQMEPPIDSRRGLPPEATRGARLRNWAGQVLRRIGQEVLWAFMVPLQLLLIALFNVAAICLVLWLFSVL